MIWIFIVLLAISIIIWFIILDIKDIRNARKKVDDKNSLILISTRTVFEYSNDYVRIWLEIYEDDPTTCIFTHLLVDEKYRQQGYGTQALVDAEKIAKNHGCTIIYLKVENNSWMYDWYIRQGYEFDNFDVDNYVWLYKDLKMYE